MSQNNLPPQLHFTSEQVEGIAKAILPADVCITLSAEIAPNGKADLQIAVLGTTKNLIHLLLDACNKQPAFGYLILQAAMEYVDSQQEKEGEKKQEMSDLERKINEKGGFNNGRGN